MNALPGRLRYLWRYFRPLLAPLLLGGLLFFMLQEPILWWLQGQQRYDEVHDDEHRDPLVRNNLHKTRSPCQRRGGLRSSRKMPCLGSILTRPPEIEAEEG